MMMMMGDEEVFFSFDFTHSTIVRYFSLFSHFYELKKSQRKKYVMEVFCDHLRYLWDSTNSTSFILTRLWHMKNIFVLITSVEVIWKHTSSTTLINSSHLQSPLAHFILFLPLSPFFLFSSLSFNEQEVELKIHEMEMSSRMLKASISIPSMDGILVLCVLSLMKQKTSKRQ